MRFKETELITERLFRQPANHMSALELKITTSAQMVIQQLVYGTKKLTDSRKGLGESIVDLPISRSKRGELLCFGVI